VNEAAENLTELIVEDDWARLPSAMLQLLPHFADISVARLTRSTDMWSDAYQRLMAEVNE